MFGQKHMIFHIENARRIVTALDKCPELHEMKTVTPQHGGNGAPVEHQRALFHPVEKPVKPTTTQAALLHAREFEPGAVEAFPLFGGERRAYRTRIAPRRLDATADTRQIIGIESEIGDDVFCRRLIIFFVKARLAIRHHKRRMPFVADTFFHAFCAGGHERQTIGDAQDTRQVFRAFHVTRDPVEIIGGTTKHHLKL